MVEKHVDHDRNLFLSLAAVLVGFGVLMVHSASITSWPTEFEQVYLSRHLTFLAIGIVAGAVCACLPSRVWYQTAPYLFVGTILLLAAVLIPGVGTEVNGARRWLRYGGYSVQPSEFTKIALPLLVCRMIDRRRCHLGRWVAGTVPLMLPLIVTAPLVLMQPDLGTTVFLAAGCGVALFIGGWPIRNFLLGGLVTAPAAAFLLVMKPYQVRRITGFLAAWNDLNDAPYQLKQSLVTMGAGGLFGVGLGRGWQKLSFLPEANTDFVFAVVGEELGLVGALSVVALWIGLYVAGLRLLRPLGRGGFAYIAAFTLLTQLVLQAALNVAVVTAMVPPKGISHPLISYGGSSLLASLMSLGIILSLARSTDDLQITD